MICAILLVTKAWKKHTEIVRGNPIRTYEGEKFVRVIKSEPEEN